MQCLIKQLAVITDETSLKDVKPITSSPSRAQTWHRLVLQTGTPDSTGEGMIMKR